MSSLPRVSIALPVYNGLPYLGEAIDSILAQTFNDFELVISDNASTDGTSELCQAYAARDARIRYIRQPSNVGASRNFNFAMQQCRAPLVKWSAHDDLIGPAFLARCIEMYDRAPRSVVLVFTRRQLIDPDGRHRPTTEAQAGVGLHNLSFGRLVRMRGSRFPIFAFGLIRADALRRTRMLTSYVAADLLLSAELRLQGEFWEVPETLYFQRVFGAAPSRRERLTVRGEAIWFDPANARRRVFPELELLVQHAIAIHRTKLPLQRSLACYLAMLGQITMRLSRNLQRSHWNVWSRASLEMTRMSDSTYLPLRLWASASAIARGDLHDLRTAVMPRTSAEPAGLLAFAADRLIRRDDPHADDLLQQWLTRHDSARQMAVMQALARHAPFVRNDRFQLPAHARGSELLTGAGEGRPPSLS